MLIAFILSACLNVGLGVTVYFLRYLLKATSTVALSTPIAVQREAPIAARAALAASEGFTGLTAAEVAEEAKERERMSAEARQLLAEEFGVNPEYLDEISKL